MAEDEKKPDSLALELPGFKITVGGDL